MLAVEAVLTLALLGVCSFAPGFYLVRRLPWNPIEKLCGAVAASLIAVYLIAWAVYCFAPGSETGVFRAISLAAAVLAALSWRGIRRLTVSFGARQALRGYGFLLVWAGLVLAMIRNFSGAGWSGDWAEHFQRTLFFLHQFPIQTPIVGNYALPARPPMMNVLAAFFLAQTADRFEIFQIVFLVLNVLAFLPCCLMLRALVPGRRKWRALPLVALFALNPAFVENTTYAWTKSLTVFFVVFALWLYLAGLRKRDNVRIAAAFFCLAAGLLVHYSAGPYIAFLAGHYLLRVFPAQKRKWASVAAIAVPCALLLATWFGWSLRAYGARTTFASNTSITSSQQYSGGNWKKIAANVFDTVVPVYLRDSAPLSMFEQPNAAGKLRDAFFILYQTNLIFGMGLVGGPVILWLLYQVYRGRGGRAPEGSFWLWLVPVVTGLGIAVVGERDLMGVAHLTLLPIEMLGVTMLAAAFPWRRGLAVTIVAGCALDFAFGIFLHDRVQNLDNSAEKTVFTGLGLVNSQLEIGAPGPDSLTGAAWRNWYWKVQYGACQQWIRQLDAYPQWGEAARKLSAALQVVIDENNRTWGGWFARNGGAMQFLGDHLAGPSLGFLDAPSVLLLIAFAALMRRFSKEALKAPQPAKTPHPAAAVPRKKAVAAARKR